MAAMFKVPYNITNGTHTANVTIPEGAVASGSCEADKDKQNIIISWSVGGSGNDSITFQFERNSTAKNFVISAISGVLLKDDDHFPNATGK